MLFSSMVFLWIFLPIIMVCHFFIKEKYRNYLLLLASLIFYAWGEPKYIILMLVSITLNYWFGIAIDQCINIKYEKVLLILSIASNLGILLYFKYFNFIVENINTVFDGNITSRTIILPIGISFYTFQALSYVIDVYRGKHGNSIVKVQKNYLNLALYVSFFPQLIAGPIVKYKDIQDQIEHRVISSQKVAYGIRRFVFGLGKKVLISNILAYTADSIFELSTTELSMPIAWLGIICYTLQIYYDFSGYSDMAIGLGKIFGFDFVENFNYPYVSQSIQEFWRRWHMSLSTWFREYLYIPLGGNRKGINRTYINLLIVFLATGVWHGASWNFIIWGLFHGLFLIIERMKLGEILKKNRFKSINHIYTLLVVMIGWVFFKATGLKQAINYLLVMFVPGMLVEGKTNIYAYLDREVVLVLVIAILGCGIIQKKFEGITRRIFDESMTYSYEIVVLPIILMLCIMNLINSSYNPFIYFQF